MARNALHAKAPRFSPGLASSRLRGEVKWRRLNVIASVSEAIHSAASKKEWIASSQVLLAMTLRQSLNVVPATEPGPKRRGLSFIKTLFDDFRVTPLPVVMGPGSEAGTTAKTSLRANGSRECAPDDRLREAIHCVFASSHPQASAE
jgi:hypothetical protein